MTNNVVIDKDAAFDLIDELRAAIPEEIRAAKRINSEGERILEKAQEEAERIVARAQEQAAFLIEERGLTAAAEDESRADHRRGPGRGGRGPARRRRVRGRGPDRARGRGRPDAPEHQEGDRPARRAAAARPGAVRGTRRARRGRRGRRRMGRRSRAGGGARDPHRTDVTRADAREALTVNVASLLGEPHGSVRDLVFDDVELDLGDDLRLARPARARVRLTRTNRGLLVDGDVRRRPSRRRAAAVSGPSRRPSSRRFEEEALQTHRARDGRPDRPCRRAGRRPPDRPPRDRARAIRPRGDPARRADRRRSAGPDCPGLCAVCGEELASGPHDHGEEPIDPRLEALRAFRVDGGDETA